MTIDWWTLGIQAINVTVLVWLLARFFWRPVAAMIEQRRATAQQILAEVETKRGQAAEALAEIERTRAGFDKEREAIIAAAHKAAEETRATLLAAATKEAAAIEAAATEAMAKEQNVAEAAWMERASRLAVEIAQRLVARLDGPVVSAAFLDWLLREIRALPDSVREAVCTKGVALEVMSATPIAPAEQERYRKLIGEAFAACPELTFKVDATLICGLELRGAHFVLSNSWRADLTKIRADLVHDKRS
jgi:F-type H+-transporting ATPase subunit b